ncbi:Uncharacterised protein [uncultured archaeon]|nr:Uncharacterised protein [uncultured archaeon]
MPIRPNKPIMFALPHTNQEVEAAMADFLRVIKGKKRLFIEMSHFEPGSDLSDFALLANKAHKLGVEIVPLDKSKRTISKHQRASYPFTEELLHNKWPLSESYHRYRNMDLREKKWERLLQGTTSRDVIVMHTEHAKAMVQRLGLPKSNILYFAPSDMGDYSGLRRMAINERQKIEALRIARGLAKSKKRMTPKQKRIRRT